MFEKIKAFFTAKLFLTKGQVITQGMLYALEKRVETLNASISGYKSANTRLKARYEMLEIAHIKCTKDVCSDCPIVDKNGRLK
jgi:hypothetical protein